ncbi:hypothetical protein OAT70_00395 [Gammaproteobacteria bacterium]|nr:hypothetical protein [Gammaproteobacteria bacterium]
MFYSANNDSSFELIILSNQCCYHFYVDLSQVPKIDACIVSCAPDDSTAYEFKSQDHAWEFFGIKIKQHAH